MISLQNTQSKASTMWNFLLFDLPVHKETARLKMVSVMRLTAVSTAKVSYSFETSALLKSN
jgi:hypothetical protein